MLSEVIRHELSHAFLYESGRVSDAENEEMAEYLSVIVPKICAAEKWIQSNLTSD